MAGCLRPEARDTCRSDPKGDGRESGKNGGSARASRRTSGEAGRARGLGDESSEGRKRGNRPALTASSFPSFAAREGGPPRPAKVLPRGRRGKRGRGSRPVEEPPGVSRRPQGKGGTALGRAGGGGRRPGEFTCRRGRKAEQRWALGGCPVLPANDDGPRGTSGRHRNPPVCRRKIPEASRGRPSEGGRPWRRRSLRGERGRG